MIKWNEEYQVYVSDDGKVYNKDMKEYKLHDNKTGYLQFITSRNGKRIVKRVHRLVYETFVGKIPEGLQVDHINSIKTDNRLENLQLLTGLENTRKSNLKSDFGLKYFDHFEYSSSENIKQYMKEYYWFRKHGKCSWE